MGGGLGFLSHHQRSEQERVMMQEVMMRIGVSCLVSMCAPATRETFEFESVCHRSGKKFVPGNISLSSIAERPAVRQNTKITPCTNIQHLLG